MKPAKQKPPKRVGGCSRVKKYPGTTHSKKTLNGKRTWK